MKTLFRLPVTSTGLAAAIVLGLAAPAISFANGSIGTATAAGQAPSVVSGERCEAPSSAATPAQHATISASFTASWNNINSVNDGSVVHNGGAQNQLWGTYSSNRPAQQWLQYDWSGQGTLTGASIAFWSDNASDTAGDGLAVPTSWKLQSWDGASWTDIALKDGASYPRAKDAVNAVTFASPINTSKLRAVFDATTNGTSFAALGVSEFAVTGDVAPNPVLGEEILTSDSFNVAVSRSTGGVYHLGNATDGPSCTNYVMNPKNRPSFDVNDSRWVGDLGLKVDGSPRMTGLSDDIRKVTSTEAGIEVGYSGTSANAAGIRGFNLTEKYALTGESRDVLDWSIDIENTSAQPMEIQDLSVPLLMNSWWKEHDQTAIYEQNVARHSFVADDGSYMYWQRPNGEGPYLVMVPDENTQLEFKDKARPGEGPFAEVDPNFEGLVEYYVHSKSAAPTRVNAGKAAQYLPATSATVPAGQKTSYGFTFRWAENYADLHNVLYEAGVVDTVSLPGMTIPQDTTAKLAVRAKAGIDAVVPGGGLGAAGNDATITAAGEANGYKLYDVKFNSLGENFVTVQYAGGKKSVLQYYSIEPVEKLIEANASFIAKNQQAKDPARGYDGAYLQWDMRTKQMVTRQNVGTTALTGIDEFKLRWMTGGSDDAGLSPAAFLAEKNSLSPSGDQITSLDYYIDNFLLGYLQNQWKDGQRTWNVYHWYDGGDGDRPATGSDAGNGGSGDGLATWRVMNSPHIWNTYYGMYKIAKAHPELTKRSAAEYLDFAYNTMRAYFEHSDAGAWLPNASREMASMGELSLPLVRDALKDAGRTAEADKLQQFFQNKYNVFASKKYPFASEMSIDTTAFEANYTLAKMFGDNELARKVTSASLSARGTQPLWYYYGGDNRHMGESWWNLGYETQLGAWQQQEYLTSYDAPANGFDFDETMRSTYGAYLAGWANINSGQISTDPANYGAASWQFQSEKGTSEYSFMPNLNGWWAWSGESALGFWGGLKTAAVDVVDDKIFGTYAYGGDAKLVGGTYQITPKDGVRQRLNMFNKNKFGVEISGAKYTAAKIATDLSTVELALENVTDATYSPTFSLRNLPTGTYQVFVDGTRQAQTVTSDGKTASLALSNLAKDAGTLKITSVPAASLSVTATASSRCIAGKVVLTVEASNADTVPLAMTFTSTYGQKAFTAVQPGKKAVHAFTTRAASIPAGQATVKATATVNGQPTTVDVQANYTSRSCP
ncbi:MULTISPECIES: DUF5695 domain-containing protein [unclassified Arthrobacter]|uniref:DUF5695 domain-containing protein n=1 Tax=unclassified Arthrobacter TaxID=235627 RepID=UPI002882E180|nr:MULTISPECIES: DUF5695 domain-containing protein [unclassified Arthrobacter]